MQSRMYVFGGLLFLVLAGACQKNGQTYKGGASKSAEQKAKEEQAAAAAAAAASGLEFGAAKEAYMCNGSKRVIGLIGKPHMMESLALLCGESGPTPLYSDLVAKAYAGSGEASVSLVSSTTDDMYNTRMIVAFAMKAPLSDPAAFYSLKAHNVLANGLRNNKSELVATVESRQNFPGRRSIEEIILNYSLNKSENGALFDVRRTEFNTYLLDEARTDVTVSTEELLDVEKSASYSHFRGIVLGIKADNTSTVLVFLTDMGIKNRIDPLRLQRTLMALNSEMQKVMFPLFLKAAP